MDIIKKIPNIKLDRNIIIYDNINYDEILAFKKKYKLQNWLDADVFGIYQVYNGFIYNPPFFNNIIVLKQMMPDDSLKELWNMTLFNGYILLNSKFKYLYGKSVIYEKDDKILVQKNIRLTYQFPKYRVIDFIIAGTMKGGTTAGITNFTKHPDISMVKEEIHFFDAKETYQKGLNWYKSHFDYSKRMVGDKAPDVMYQTSCLELLQLANPQVKIILMLRNPIHRAYSHWKMLRDEFKNKSSFEYCVNNEIKNKWGENRLYKVSFWSHIVQRGLYYQQIEEILKYFSKDNLLILISENIRKDMDKEYQKIFDFLEIPTFHTTFVEDFVSKKTDTIKEDSKIYKLLKKIYKTDVKNLEKMLGYKTGWW